MSSIVTLIIVDHPKPVDVAILLSTTSYTLLTLRTVSTPVSCLNDGFVVP